MKLIHYTIRNLFVPLLIIMTVWAFVFYILVLHEVNDETNDTLQNYKEIIIKQALADTTFLKDHIGLMNSYYIREIPADQANLSKDEFYDDTKYIEIENEHEPIRVLRTSFMTPNEKYYELKIEISTLEKEDLTETVLWATIILYILLICCILLVTHSVFKKSFIPLYTILDWLRRYHPAKPSEPLVNQTSIEEFNILNQAFRDATERGIKVYEEQKQFVENASHELQTPIAVCMNKLELLSENQDCTEEQLAEIADIYRTLQGISKMNKSLLLLSRIENKQFPDEEEVNITQLVQSVTNEFIEMYENKNIQLYFIKEEPLSCIMNPALAQTMIKNLVRNAFIHNIPEGEIYIQITTDSLSIENTSDSPELNRDKLFKRFGKQSNRPDSTGLGLAVIQSIALIYKIDLTYTYNGKHRFILTFK
ncbi:HAMP domain-containing sensor histidine kinase [Parabacteroides sp. PF5-9]|uniref:sensor histidine kinase n=1 Tax=Parabacteroides sp. PF5-9 TaxID=1742404 RepID=UPI00247693BC|nr:HAMP domain-containing sensor histidine kinase [Parabacteroides sp. PF5-9]MDH6358577.1 signal transduction histidine kinase [Parabacteroides sp. PF5-9]